jgi:large subunit ribosomal protein L21
LAIVPEEFMYAIIETGGKQYQVKEGDIINVELLEGDSNVKFDKILFFFDGKTPHIGVPHLTNCAIHAELVGEVKGPKVIAFKYKQRKSSRRMVGHRQKYSSVKITKIAAV